MTVSSECVAHPGNGLVTGNAFFGLFHIVYDR